MSCEGENHLKYYLPKKKKTPNLLSLKSNLTLIKLVCDHTAKSLAHFLQSEKSSLMKQV